QHGQDDRMLVHGQKPRRVLRTLCRRLTCVLEPLLVFGGLLPALVGLTGADQLHVGAEVPAVLAGAVGAQAEVLGGQLVEGSVSPGEQVAPAKSHVPFLRIGLRGSPELLPFLQVCRTTRRLLLRAGMPPDDGAAGHKKVPLAPPPEQAEKRSLG